MKYQYYHIQITNPQQACRFLEAAAQVDLHKLRVFRTPEGFDVKVFDKEVGQYIEQYIEGY